MRRGSGKKPCCCDMQALRDEIDRRSQSRPPLAAAMLRAGASSWAGRSTTELVGQLRDLQRAIYGTDGRKDLYEVTRPQLRKVADSVVALVAAADQPKQQDYGRAGCNERRGECDHALGSVGVTSKVTGAPDRRSPS